MSAVLHLLAPLALMLAIGCGSDNKVTAPTNPPASVPSTAPPPPPPGPLAGTVTGSTIAAYHGVPIPNATVAVDGIAAVTTDAAGNYSFVISDPGTRRVLVSADGHQYRETFVRTGETRTVTFDLIPNNGSFPFALFRQIARNGAEQPNALQPIKRWTTTPNFHVETMWRDTGAPIDQAVLQFVEREIRRVIPQLTDGKFQAGRIEFGPERWDFVQDYVSIHWDHSGNYGYLGQNPGQVQFGTASTCASIMVIHELAHAMGFWHSSVRPSVMGGTGPITNCDPWNLTADEQQVARVLYNRPVGNVEPDRDPSGTQVYAAGVGGPSRPVVCDDVLRP